jgi:pimeloyl-ACP methyl ester carboxylesterase
MDHIAPALESLRRDADAARVGQLATVLFASAPAYATVRETDAAARAYVNADRAPLLRLMAEAQLNVDSRDATRSPALFSSGLAAAVTCEDAPQIFDMRLEPPQRALAREKALTDRRRSAPDIYAPFTIDEYRRMPLDYGFIDECVSWPRVPAAHLEAMARLRGSAYPDVPALIISGDLDDLTPVADGASVAGRFARGKQIVVPNGFHVNALGHSRSECPAEIARRFIETLEVSDTKCLQAVPEVRVLGAFAQHVRELEPAAAEAGNEAVSAEMQIVTGTVLTIGDAIARIGSYTSGVAAGLRGGAFDISPGPGPATSLTLRDVRWAKDLSVSGVVLSPKRAGTGTADVVATGPGGMKGSLHVSWTEGVPQAHAMVRGAFGSRAVVAKTPAP